jgi:predicted component of type VI protein secretion system
MEILLSIQSKADGATREIKSNIGNGLVIGRGAEQGVLLDGPDLSREHLVLSTDGTNVFVTDLSSNGTWLAGNRLKPSVKTRMRPGDMIEVPGYALQVKPAAEPEKPKEAAVAQMPAPEPAPSAPPSDESAERAGLLAPVSRFIGSFSFGEKFLVLVGLVGLILLYTYLEL